MFGPVTYNISTEVFRDESKTNLRLEISPGNDNYRWFIFLSLDYNRSGPTRLDTSPSKNQGFTP